MTAPLSASDLSRVFHKLDRDGDGLVSLDELKWLLDRTVAVAGAAPCFPSLDDLEWSVGKPLLNFEDFSSFYYEISEGTGETDDLVGAFKVFDEDDDGFISCEELERVLSRLGMWDGGRGGGCERMIDAYDVDKDGRLDFQEFRTMMLLAMS
ncbi:hypothetical protein MLD38_022474 [Melastoma candidum]|uniref:Uncharacterized protein n=1 Tax=Melastoma candidum TaxID=119954 RepID=A0ACB9QJE1_9MYRT|nr:hypothetical protein MLD38_022474 [Melastoma candidum]